jgi:hypothetical protein
VSFYEVIDFLTDNFFHFFVADCTNQNAVGATTTVASGVSNALLDIDFDAESSDSQSNETMQLGLASSSGERARVASSSGGGGVATMSDDVGVQQRDAPAQMIGGWQEDDRYAEVSSDDDDDDDELAVGEAYSAKQRDYDAYERRYEAASGHDEQRDEASNGGSGQFERTSDGGAAWAGSGVWLGGDAQLCLTPRLERARFLPALNVLGRAEGEPRAVRRRVVRAIYVPQQRPARRRQRQHHSRHRRHREHREHHREHRRHRHASPSPTPERRRRRRSPSPTPRPAKRERTAVPLPAKTPITHDGQPVSVRSLACMSYCNSHTNENHCSLKRWTQD